MSLKFSKDSLVKDNFGIYRVVGVDAKADNPIYLLEFLSHLGIRNVFSRKNMLDVYSKKHQVKESNLLSFDGRMPRFTLGDYVRPQKNWPSIVSRIFFSEYDGHKYRYFVQVRGTSDLYEGQKQWVDESYLVSK